MNGLRTDPALAGYARLAGALYVLTNATAIAAFVARGRALGAGDAARIAANIAAHPSLLRLSIVGELATMAGVIVLIASLHAVLRHVDRGLALVALLWRVAENMVLAVTTLCASGLLIATGANAATGATIHLLIGLYGAGYSVGFFFLGLGSTLFGWLWWRSRRVPRPIAGFGIAASAIMAAGSIAIIAQPALRPALGMAYMAPMGIYEIGFGLWLLATGANLGSAKPIAP